MYKGDVYGFDRVTTSDKRNQLNRRPQLIFDYMLELMHIVAALGNAGEKVDNPGTA